MNTRKVIGQSVVNVEQCRSVDNAGQVVYHVSALVLQNGVKLFPLVVFTNRGEPLVDILVDVHSSEVDRK